MVIRKWLSSEELAKDKELRMRCDKLNKNELAVDESDKRYVISSGRLKKRLLDGTLSDVNYSFTSNDASTKAKNVQGGNQVTL